MNDSPTRQSRGTAQKRAAPHFYVRRYRNALTMTSVEDQKLLDRNIQRVGMFHALRKINAIVQEVENEKRIEAKAIKIALGVMGIIGIVALFYVLVESSRVKPPPSTLHVASDRFTSYVNDWAKQVQAKLGKSCINFTETGNQSVGVILSTSIMKDGTVEKVMVTKSAGMKELMRLLYGVC